MKQQSSQFSLAAVFYFLTMMSLLFSATAPFFRATTAENRLAILVYGSIQMGLVGLFVIGLMLSRARVNWMVRGGSLVHRTSFSEQGQLGFWQSIRAIGSSIPAFLFLVFAGAVISSDPFLATAFLHPLILGFQIAAIYIAVRASLSLYYGIDHRDLEIFQSGFVHGGYVFSRWEGIESIRPAIHDEGAVMVVERFRRQHHRYANEKILKTKKLSLRSDRRDDVVRVMTQLIANRE